MTQSSAQSLPTVILVPLLLALTACSTAPRAPQQALLPTPVPVSVTPLPFDLISPATVLEGPAYNREPGARYTDLLARMRAGFQLGEHDEDRVDREATWYARHPDYI